MAIVMISRGTFAGGERLAQLLGDRLSYRNISREQLLNRVRDTYGIATDKLDEMLDHAPPLFDRAARQNQRLMVVLQASLCELIGDDRVVYHGRVGHLFLAGVEHLLKVRLIAPRAKRVELAMKREGITEFEANRRIDNVDAQRVRWSRYFYGVDWTDPALYDMVLNLEWTPVEDMAELVAAATRLPAYQPSEASRAHLRDVRLASHLRARLLTDPSTSDFLLEVKAEAGKVRVSGVSQREHIDLVTQVVQKEPGVEKVEVVSLAR